MTMVGGRFALAAGEPRVGGMAEIRRGADVQDGLKTVAVKFVRSSRVRDDRIVREAFARELAALQRLEHPNIVKIIDFEPHHDPPYMVLEWLENDFSGWLAATPPRDWGEFYERIGRPLLEALVYALTKGIVHRDFKPGNILFDDHGTPKITDFGIAKLIASPTAPGAPTLAQYKSEPYAPFDEGNAHDARDAYSFAVLALRCLSGTDFTAHEHVSSALGAFAGPADVRDVLYRALAANPADRFRDVLELQTALDAVRTRSRAAESSTRACYVTALPQAVAKLCERLDQSDERRVRTLLARDVSESLVLFFWRERETNKKIAHQFLGRTAQFRLHLGVDSRLGDHLVVLSAWPDDSVEGEAHSEYGFRPPFPFAFDNVPAGVDGVAMVRWLVGRARAA